MDSQLNQSVRVCGTSASGRLEPLKGHSSCGFVLGCGRTMALDAGAIGRSENACQRMADRQVPERGHIANHPENDKTAFAISFVAGGGHSNSGRLAWVSHPIHGLSSFSAGTSQSVGSRGCRAARGHSHFRGSEAQHCHARWVLAFRVWRIIGCSSNAAILLVPRLLDICNSACAVDSMFRWPGIVFARLLAR